MAVDCWLPETAIPQVYKLYKGEIRMKHTVKLLALLIAIGLAGCATTKDLEAVRAEARQANATADAALKTAKEAKATAQDAKVTSETTESKIDRMFKKAMHK